MPNTWSDFFLLCAGSRLRVQAALSAAVHAAAVDTSKTPKELGFTMPGEHA
jgi:hypothetical protein